MDADVCVVGAGIAGALLAWRLGQAGRSVVILDAGPRLPYPDMQRYRRLLRGEDPWPWFQADRDAYEDLAQPSLQLNSNRIKAVGGTTLHWNGNAQRLQPGDFTMRSRFGLGVDWPFDYATLEPWYLRAEEEIGVTGHPGPGEPPRSGPYPLTPFETSFVEREILHPAFSTMGLRLGANNSAINSRPRDGRPGCAAFSTCIPMCPIHARYTAMHHIHKAEATGRVLVWADCHVRRIQRGAGRRVDHVRFVDGDGREQRLAARVVVLAAGGVEVPRLLLLSGDDDRGLANSSGLVGCCFMSHPRIIVKGRLPQAFEPHRNGYATTNCWSLYQHDRLPRTGNVMLSPDPNNGPQPSVIAAHSSLWGEALQAHVTAQYGHDMDLHVKGDMLPLPTNRVRLSSRSRDRHGDPIPTVTLRLGAFDLHALDVGAGVARTLFEHMGASLIRASAPSLVRNHLMGTTRMGNAPHDSVCDAWGRCHDLDNLYVVSSSLFPTAGCSSPTLTIAALSLRTADHLVREVL